MEDKSSADHVKRPRLLPTASIKCFNCGKLGHRQAECRLKNEKMKKPITTTPASASPRPSTSSGSVVCFKCGGQGHIASRCTTAAAPTSSSAAPSVPERRVNLCEVEPPSGQLTHLGKQFQFYFDSGAECSLVKESVACKLSVNAQTK